MSLTDTKEKLTSYYLTDLGLQWFLHFFEVHSFTYCRSQFSFLLRSVKEEEFTTDHVVFNNFKGLSGKKTIPGTKQRALIIRKVKRCERRYEFDSIKEAREQLQLWLSYFPIEEFTLYRLRTQNGHTFKEKIPLLVDRNRYQNLGGKHDFK